MTGFNHVICKTSFSFNQNEKKGWSIIYFRSLSTVQDIHKYGESFSASKCFFFGRPFLRIWLFYGQPIYFTTLIAVIRLFLTQKK